MLEQLSTLMDFGLFALVLLVAGLLIFPSIHRIGPTEVGIIVKRFSTKRLPDDNPIAFQGEAGYQADLLMPGWRWKFWPFYHVQKHPWVQVPAGEVGVVIAQVGKPLPIGAKSAVFKKEFGDFSDLRSFVQSGGQKGVQRPVLAPGTLAPIHPVGFLVITKRQVFGLPVTPEFQGLKGGPSPIDLGLEPEQLNVVRVEPKGNTDMIGIVTTYDGEPLSSGDIAGRLGGFTDIVELEKSKTADDLTLIERVLGTQNQKHNNYQDFQMFLDQGGRIGLQHDPLLYGAYCLNPFLVSVELVPMLVIQQGEVAVIKSYVGLPTEDTSGADFKFGSLVRPGHRGVWQEPFRTGKFPINPHCYQAEVVPTSILTLNWADANSQAHNLDHDLKQIVAKSREGFIFRIDLQVQIHVPDKMAPRVISSVGTMKNLVSEVLQAAVGNHFRDKLQSMAAVVFIEERQSVQEGALAHIKEQINRYNIETLGVFIQDVVLPEELVKVLTQREIASQEIQTFQKERSAQDARVDMEKSKGMADAQAELAKSEVSVTIKENLAKAREAEGRGEASYRNQTGQAAGAEIEAVGMARAKAYKAQMEALGRDATALVNVMEAVSRGQVQIVPDIQVSGNGNLGLFDAVLGSFLRNGTASTTATTPARKPPPLSDPKSS